MMKKTIIALLFPVACFAQQTIEQTDNLNAGRVKINENFTDIHTTQAVGDSTTDAATTAFVLQNALVKKPGVYLPGKNTFQLFPEYTTGNGQEVFEIANAGNPIGNTENRNLVPGIINRLVGSIVVGRNMQWDNTNSKWLTPYQQSDAYGSSCFEAGGEAAILHATPSGVNFSDVPHEILLASANGTDGPTNQKFTTGYYLQSKAPLFIRWSNAAYNAAATNNTWNTISTTQPLIDLSLDAEKGSSANHDYLETIKLTGTGSGTAINFARGGAAGTLASPAVTTTNALQGEIGAKGFDGTTWQKSARLGFVTRGTISSGNVPMGFLFYTSTTNTAGLTPRIEIAPSGNTGFGVTGAAAQTAKVHIAAGTATAGTAPLKIIEGTNLTTPEDGAIEHTSDNLNFTAGSTRYTLAKTLTATASLNFDLTSVNSEDLTITVTGAADGDPVTIAVPSASATANVTFTAWVSASNTVTIRAARVDVASGADPASGTFRASVIKY